MKRKALITGITGQDGSYLAEFLLRKDYEVHGIVRRVAIEDPEHRLWRIKHLLSEVELHPASLESYPSLFKTMTSLQPDEVYQVEPDDYVIATGETHTVREFLEIAFGHVGLNYREHVVVDPQLHRPAEVNLLLGNSAKARARLGWNYGKSFPALVHEMVEADLISRKKSQSRSFFGFFFVPFVNFVDVHFFAFRIFAIRNSQYHCAIQASAAA